MISRVPARLRGATLILVAFLLVSLVAAPAFAKKERAIATEGDPGDGNLSPEIYTPSGSGGGTYVEGATAAIIPTLVFAPGGSFSLVLIPTDRFGGTLHGTVVWFPAHPAVSGFQGYRREWFPAGARRCGDVR
ncbi:MAG: hypothetical protein ABIK96_03875 [bacterium]|nr:hypothetical protein [bacterium]